MEQTEIFNQAKLLATHEQTMASNLLTIYKSLLNNYADALRRVMQTHNYNDLTSLILEIKESASAVGADRVYVAACAAKAAEPETMNGDELLNNLITEITQFNSAII